VKHDTRKQNEGLNIHNGEIKRAGEAEQIKTNGSQQLKAITKLVGGRAIKRGSWRGNGKSRQSIHEVSS